MHSSLEWHMLLQAAVSCTAIWLVVVVNVKGAHALFLNLRLKLTHTHKIPVWLRFQFSLRHVVAVVAVLVPTSPQLYMNDIDWLSEIVSRSFLLLLLLPSSCKIFNLWKFMQHCLCEHLILWTMNIVEINLSSFSVILRSRTIKFMMNNL